MFLDTETASVEVKSAAPPYMYIRGQKVEGHLKYVYYNTVFVCYQEYTNGVPFVLRR